MATRTLPSLTLCPLVAGLPFLPLWLLDGTSSVLLAFWRGGQAEPPHVSDALEDGHDRQDGDHEDDGDEADGQPKPGQGDPGDHEDQALGTRGEADAGAETDALGARVRVADQERSRERD